MSVYVDSAKTPYRRMVMCHMLADSTRELVDMARLIDVPVRWIQDAGGRKEHFDICASKRALAIKAGAVEIGMRKVAELINRRPSTPKEGWNEGEQR